MKIGKVTKISQLEIDEDKDWKGKKIENVLGLLQSKPPSGKCCVTNLFVDPGTGKLIIEYDDTPV